MGIPMICQKDKLPKLKKKNIKKKLMANCKEALTKFILNLIFLVSHITPNFVTVINCFSPSLKQKID